MARRFARILWVTPPAHSAVWVASALLILIVSVSFALGLLGSRKGRLPRTDFRSAVGAQEPRRVVSLGGVDIAYTDSGGEGPAIVCLHAIGHGARDFENLSRRLSPEYRVLALDFPNQGNSGRDPEPASGKRYTELVSQFIDRLHLNSITLLGNSIGGAAAIRYASQRPERVKSLILCDSGGLAEPTRVGRVFIGGFVQFFAAGRRGAFWFPWAFSQYYSRVLQKEAARQERDRIVRSAYEIAPTLEEAWRSFARPEENLLPVLPQIRCPVLIAWAKDDVVLPLSGNAPVFGRFPNYQLEIFAGGHAAFLEDPERFEQAVRSFLKRTYGGPHS